MIGAVIGDVAGSVYEFSNIKTKKFPLLSPHCNYTDDTLMTIAVADALREAGRSPDLSEHMAASMIRTARHFPIPTGVGGYGHSFMKWLNKAKYVKTPKPYNSYGNGSAMRASPCGEYADTLDEALRLAEISAAVTHSHPDGIKGAQAVAAAVWMAGHGSEKAEIREYIGSNFYALDRTVDEIRPDYRFEIACGKTVPPALIAFLDSVSFEDALRNAISLGGDSDTIADITCAAAWPFYARQGVDETMAGLKESVLALLPESLRARVENWENEYGQYSTL